MALSLENIQKDLERQRYTWLITGCAGFIGSNILEFLLNSNQKVVGLDNFSTGFQKNLDMVRDNVGETYWKNFQFFEGDLRDLEMCRRVTNDVDFVLHQGALGSVPRSLKDPISSCENNINGTLNIFHAAKESEVKKVVFASSSSVYGDDPTLPKQEEKVGNPLSPYAITKKTNELYARVFMEHYGLPILGIRYFNVFGPRQNPDGAYAAVIPKWVKALINNDVVKIFGDGETSRDFTYIENVIAINVITSLSKVDFSPGTIINGALGGSISLNDLFEHLKTGLSQRFGHVEDIRPKYEDFRPGDIRHSMANMDLAKSVFSYEPITSVQDGIKKSLDWYVNHL